jgi:hypothetical protein
MDTPGILDRPIGMHNEIEHLTYATVMHFPDALLLYVIDPTSLAGEYTSSLINQLNIRSYLKRTFPEHSWVDVLTKDDVFSCSPAMQEEFRTVVRDYNEVAEFQRLSRKLSTVEGESESDVQQLGQGCGQGHVPFDTDACVRSGGGSSSSSDATDASPSSAVEVQVQGSLNCGLCEPYPLASVVAVSAAPDTTATDILPGSTVSVDQLVRRIAEHFREREVK